MVSVYGSLAYAETLTHIGTPKWLPRSGGALLGRRIGSGPGHDLCGPYPWADFDNWDALADDFDTLRAADDPPTSAVVVISPTTKASTSDLRRAFPDHLAFFKDHQLVDLTGDFESCFRSSHRRKAKRARSTVSVEIVEDAERIAADWVELYGCLVARHEVTGAANFPEQSLRAQLGLPGVVAVVARLAGEVVGVITFTRDGEIAAYHLGAFSPAGYEREVAFALFPAAFDYLAVSGVGLVNLGGGSGWSVDGDDGLVRFKRGWATHSKPSSVGGRVLDNDAYAALCRRGSDHGFFPAYRGDRSS